MSSDESSLDYLYRQLFEHTADGVFLTRPDGTVVRANPAACRLLGRDEASITEGGRGSVVADSPALSAMLAERAARGATSGELEFVRGDGTTFIAELTSTLIPGATGGGYACTIFRDVTARKAADAQVRRAEAMLKDVTDAVPEPIFLKDRQGRWVFANPATLAVVGRSLEEVVGKTDREIYPDSAIGEALEANDQRIMESGVAEELEETVQSRDECRVYLSTKAPLFARDGSVVGLVGSARDITARKRSEEHLREREYLLSESQRIAHIGTWMLELPSNRVLWSAENFRIYGVPDDGQPLTLDAYLALIHPDDRAPMLEWIHACAARERPGAIDFRIVRPDGGRRVLEGRGELLEASELRPQRMVGTSQDVTERRHAEEDRARLTTAIEQTGEIVVVTDASGVIQYVNPAFEAVTGYTRAEVLGQKPSILKSGVQDAQTYRDLWQTITGGQTWQGRLVNRKKDGTLYTEDATISPVKQASGTITSYVAVKRDVSHALALEAQLLQSQKMEGIGRLAGGVAHDFNNLLSVILSYTDLMLDQLRPGDPLCADINEIVRAAQRAAALTRQLLAFSRKQVLQPVVLDLNQVVVDIKRMLGRIIGEDIVLDLRPARDLWRVKADPGQIEQVVMNLATNARDAMPDGGRLMIETANVVLDDAYVARHGGAVAGPHVMLAVTDSGLGMDDATTARIFEPFFTTKGPGRGTGLGLSTVYGIVKQSGGTVYVYSESGAGTTFKIYLPREEAVPAELVASPEVTAHARAVETILVVEDDEAVRRLAQRILETAGYTVVAASSGPDALAICSRPDVPIDMVLTDVVMPQMSGRAFADRIPNVRPGIPVLFMSGYADHAIVHHGILDADTQFIPKPLTQDSLLRKVREVLDGGAPRGSADDNGSAQ